MNLPLRPNIYIKKKTLLEDFQTHKETQVIILFALSLFWNRSVNEWIWPALILLPKVIDDTYILTKAKKCWMNVFSENIFLLYSG